jgi:L-threonylcarbamoyladenylate synthase
MTKMQLSNNTPIILPSTEENIEIATKMLRFGEIIAFPTETVYGLGAAAHDDDAVQKIYKAKGRPSNNPLIIHVDSLAMAQRYGVFNQRSIALAEAFFPAPLTLVVPAIKGAVAKCALAGGDTVAIRCPAHPVARALITAAGFGIAAPSANISGQISPTNAQHVASEFQHLPLVILDGGACEIGLESTVLDCTSDEFRILRHGAITEADLDCSPLAGFNHKVVEQQVNAKREPWGESNHNITPHASASGKAFASAALPQGESEAQHQKLVLKSPGQLASHYAPKSKLRLNVLFPNADELFLGFGDYFCLDNPANLNLSESGDLTEAAHNLYDYLRRLDEIAQNNSTISGISCAPIPNHGIGIAINDRLTRAAFDK